MSVRSKILACVALAAGLATAPAMAAPIVTNGDFANGLGSFQTFNSGSTLLGGGWTVSSGSVDQIGGYWQSPTVGGGSVDLDGNSPGGISQTISLSAGSYLLSFFLSGNPDGSPATKNITASVGATSQAFSYTLAGNTHSNMMYTQEFLAFTTAGGNVLLSFDSNDSGTPYGASIGGVSIESTTPVPEPVTLSLFAAGLAGAAALRRRKKSAQA